MEQLPSSILGARRILDKMKELRPIVETGYENILLVRLLIEEVGCGVKNARACYRDHGDTQKEGMACCLEEADRG